MSENLITKYVQNNVVTDKEIKEYEYNKARLKNTALSATVSVGLISNILVNDANPTKNVAAITISDIKQEVVIAEETTDFKSIEFHQLLASETVTKVKEINYKDQSITYYSDKGAIIYSPVKGTIVNNKEQKLIIKHKTSNENTYYSVLEGIQTSLKAGDKLDKATEIGTVSGGVLKFAVAEELKNDTPTSFVNSETLKVISDSFGIKVEQKTDSKKKENVTDHSNKKEATAKKSTKPSHTFEATKEERAVINKLPYGKTILNAAKKHDVDPVLVAGLIKQESQFDSNATSGSGAMGLMQLMPDTAEWLGVNDGYNVEENVDAGVKYLKQLITKYNDPEIALYAYNGGPGNVDDWKAEGLSPSEFPWKETREYAPKVLTNVKTFKEEADPKAAYADQINSISKDYKEPIDFGSISGQLSGFKIGVDAGHYEAAPGAVSYDSETTELQVNREIKNLVIAKLKEAGATVVDSNGDTKSLQPGQRAEAFDHSNVDFALSLHNNAATDNSASGTETLFESGVSDSKVLAQSIQSNLVKAVHTIDDRGVVARDNLGVFTEGDTVTALVETGFMSNPYDMELLRNDVVLENIANAIVKGLADYAVTLEASDKKDHSEPKQDKAADKNQNEKQSESDKKEEEQISDKEDKTRTEETKDSSSDKSESDKKEDKTSSETADNKTAEDDVNVNDSKEKEQPNRRDEENETKPKETNTTSEESEKEDDITTESPAANEASDSIEIEEGQNIEEDTEVESESPKKTEEEFNEDTSTVSEEEEEEHDFIFSKFFN